MFSSINKICFQKVCLFSLVIFMETPDALSLLNGFRFKLPYKVWDCFSKNFDYTLNIWNHCYFSCKYSNNSVLSVSQIHANTRLFVNVCFTTCINSLYTCTINWDETLMPIKWSRVSCSHCTGAIQYSSQLVIYYSIYPEHLTWLMLNTCFYMNFLDFIAFWTYYNVGSRNKRRCLWKSSYHCKNGLS